jgi:hypothetical protein
MGGFTVIPSMVTSTPAGFIGLEATLSAASIDDRRARLYSW